jgi:hypothetical protein
MNSSFSIASLSSLKSETTTPESEKVEPNSSQKAESFTITTPSTSGMARTQSELVFGTKTEVFDWTRIGNSESNLVLMPGDPSLFQTSVEWSKPVLRSPVSLSELVLKQQQQQQQQQQLFQTHPRTQSSILRIPKADLEVFAKTLKEYHESIRCWL